MNLDIFDLRNKLESKEIEPLYELSGGMMNKAYVFKYEGKKYIHYIPTAQANEMVNRSLEKEAQNIAYELGITSQCVAFYNDGVKIIEFIEGDSLNHIEEIDYSKVADMLHKLHSSEKLSAQNYCPFIKLTNYEAEALKLGIKLSDSFYKFLNIVMTQKDFLESQEKRLCHNDFQKSNIVKSNDDNYYMIDFEFAMNNDPYYDIACFGNNNVEDGFSLLKVYCEHRLTMNDINKYFYWRIFISLQWYLVALIKDKRGEGKKHHFDFKEVAKHFLNNASRAYELLLNKSDFPGEEK